MSKGIATLLPVTLSLAVGLFGCGGGGSISPQLPPPVLSVSVSPSGSNVHAGTMQTFTATVNNDATNKGVTWSVSCTTTPCGWMSPTSSASGMAATYIVPSTPPAANPAVTITATSVADSSKSAATTVTVVPAVPNFAYTGNFDSTISAFTVDPNSGALSPVSGSPYAAGYRPFSAAVDRLGKFLYVPNDVAGNLSAYAIDSSTGALTEVAGSPFAVGAYPQSVAVDPTGRFVYVASTNSNSISGFTIDASTGVLTPISGSPFPTIANPGSITVDPSGQYAYVGSSLFPDIASFKIDSNTGALTSTGIPGLPATVGCSFAYTAVDPTDKFVLMDSFCNGVYALTINAADGTLTLVAGSPFAATSPIIWQSSLSIEPTGKYAYVTDEYYGNILVLAIDPTSGALSPISGSPFSSGGYTFSASVDPSGKFLYMVDDNSSVFGFNLDPTSGAPSPMTGSPFATGTQPHAVVVTGKIQ